MTRIDKITSSIMNASAKAIGAISKAKPMKQLADQFQKNPEKTLALTTISSIVIKDGVGCYKYVTQSLNNDKIPEEKRSFVAALDLTNGFLMIAAQIGMFLLMKKFSKPLFEKLFKKSFNPQMKKDLEYMIRAEQKKAGEMPARKLNIEKSYQKVKEDTLGLFKFVVDLAAATIIGKRIIVPLIATPLANVVKDKMNAGKHKDEDELTPTEKVANEIREEFDEIAGVDDDAHEVDNDNDHEEDDD